jgi:AAA ATPase domain
VSSLHLKSFSVKDYRSIVRTERIALSDLTVLVGPNNEGKSNILQALVTGMQYLGERRPAGGVGRWRAEARFEGRYIWERDFPVSKQAKRSSQRSVLEYVFGMSDAETSALAETIGHNINSDLPITLTFGKSGPVVFTIPKQRVGTQMAAKREEIVAFLREHIHIQYIPAVRSADQATVVVNDMVRRELDTLSSDPAYELALQKIRDLQKPVIAAMESNLAQTLREVLPEVRDVSLQVEDALRNRVAVRLNVDDGDWTDVALKGDGVQSLAALALLRHYAAVSRGRQDLILAVEEPEAHLHPQAVHGLRTVLREIAKTQQVILTTHSPVLVNRLDVASNVLVLKNRAQPARSVPELRDALGVKAADNLTSADVVLMVEGEKDKKILHALLSLSSRELSHALGSDALVIQPVNGAGNLSYVVTGLLVSLCRVHAFLDNDTAGTEAGQRAQQAGVLEATDITYAASMGKGQTEIEDLIVGDTYRQAVLDNFNVDCNASLGKAKSLSWVERMRLQFTSQGQEWSPEVETMLKSVIAKAIAAAPKDAVIPACQGVIDALVRALKQKLSAAP